ncbi:MAG: serpin family protein, partial [Candidatus Eremiobacterota bacterium]
MNTIRQPIQLPQHRLVSEGGTDWYFVTPPENPPDEVHLNGSSGGPVQTHEFQPADGAHSAPPGRGESRTGAVDVQLRLFQEDPSPGLVETPSAAGPVTKQELSLAVQASNRFALDLFRQVATETSEGFFLAPSTVTGCLSMVLAGARREAAQGLTRTLHLEELSGSRLHAAVGELMKRTRADESGMSVQVSNRVFADNGYPLNPEYRESTRDHYGAEVAEASFRDNPEAARQEINGLVSQDTGGRIPELLPANSIGPDARLVLTSAIHFDGTWMTPFPEFLDEKADFFVPGQSEPVAVDMMNVKDTFNYAAVNLDGRPALPDREPDLQLVELPYQGGRFSRLVLVPGA